MKIHNWDEIEHEAMSPGIARRVVHSDRMTIARIYLEQGSVVPRHSHEHEQVSYVLEGRLKFFFDDRELVVGAGESRARPRGLGSEDWERNTMSSGVQGCAFFEIVTVRTRKSCCGTGKRSTCSLATKRVVSAGSAM